MGLNLASIDTNILLRIMLEDDAVLYERAMELVTRPRTYLYVPNQVITESVYVMENDPYNYPRANIVDLIRKTMLAPRLDYDEELFEKVFALYEKHPKLSFNDCYLACKMERKDRLPFYTMDEKLAKQCKIATLV